MFIPLLLINLVYGRIYRMVLLLILIILESIPNKKNIQQIMTFAAFGVALIKAYMFYGYGTGKTYVLDAILKNNYFFDLLNRVR